MDNPFDAFDALYCINLDSQPERWKKLIGQLDRLGIASRVQRVSAVPTPENHHIGCAASWRRVAADAFGRGFHRPLVLEDDVLFRRDTIDILERAVGELDVLDWDLCYLGATKRRGDFPPAGPGSHWLRTGLTTSLHALVLGRRAQAQILVDLPPDLPELTEWIGRELAIDLYLGRAAVDGRLSGLLLKDKVATQPVLLKYDDGDRPIREHFDLPS